MNNVFVVQGIGFIGVALSLLSYQIKSNKVLYMMQTLGCLVFCLQFALMGQFSGTFSLFVTILRNCMILGHKKYEWLKWKGWILVLMGISVFVMILTWNGPLSILATLGVFACHYFYWENDAQKIRIGNLFIASPSWIIYDVCVGNLAGVVNESICMGSVLLSIYRYGWNAMSGENSEFQN